MSQPLINVQALFARKLRDSAQEREDMVKSRINEFNNRHRHPRPDGHSEPKSGKVRPLWGE